MKLKTKNTRRIVGLCLILALLLCVLSSMAGVRAQELQTVRVGYFAFDGYHMLGADGERSGYGYELLQRLAGYTDWRYEYVGYDSSWSDMQLMLESGEIDLLTSAQKTADRLERFDFSEKSIGTSAAILTVKAGDTRYLNPDYADWSGMRVGMIENNSRNDGFAAFAEQHGFGYEAVFFESTEAMVAALKEGGKIDAVLTSNLRSIDGEWIIAQFDTSPFYIMVKKGNSELLAQVNNAIAQLELNAPEFRTQLMSEYYTPDNGGEIAFTLEEREFIEAHKNESFTAIVNPDREPYSSFENGEPVGIISEIAALIIERSGINVSFIEPETREKYLELARSGGADIRFDASRDYFQLEEQGYRVTEPYFDISISRLYKKDAAKFSSLALLKDSDIAHKYNEYFLGEYDTAEYYGSTEEVVQAVLSGRQDAAFLYIRSAELASQLDETNRLAVEDIFGYDNSFAVAVSASQDPLLYSILNKAVASIGVDEISAIDERYSAIKEKPFSLIGYMYDYPLHIVVMIIVLFVIAALIGITSHLTKEKRREKAKLEAEKRQNALLADALAVAERADAAKSQFLSRVSHEMRTPLNAIIGFLELAKDADSERTQKYLTNSEIAAKQLLSVINDVLDMSSIESGKLKLAHASFDFRHLIHSVTSIFITQCAEKGIEYETKLLTPVNEWLIGDQLRVNQILINLLGNAVKFTSKGHVWLSISQLAEKDGKVFLRFEVSDTGCGMSEDMLERLFKPFEQESSATAQRYGGNGLGLSIVKNLVSMMDGAIRVDSVPDKGTSFTIDLPFVKCETDLGMRALEGKDAIRVLAVDDEAIELDYISVVLTRLGVRHTCVNNADAALNELNRAQEKDNDPYNVCLIDWRMPNMNGIETTKRIRERYGKNVVVIVVSAYEHHQADEVVKQAGANIFLTKPIFQSSLFDLFVTLTGGSIAKKEAAPVTRNFAGKRLLIAEDNAMNRMVVEGLVEKFGIESDCVVDGAEAVEKFLASPLDYYGAILMDIQMPRMDGFEATRSIRASSRPDAKKIQIIALTANAFSDDIAKSLSSGMNAHVTKPIEPALLAAALDKVFAGD